jgi:hypothetical protein
MNKKQYFGGWLMVIVIIALVWLGAKCCQGQSYIGKPYYSLLRDVNTTFKLQVSSYRETTESDGTKNITVYYKNEQLTSFAFDAKKYCVFYLIIMPDTSGHMDFAKHLSSKYSYKSPDVWYENRPTDTVVWKLMTSADRKRTFIMVFPKDWEHRINSLIESYL